jgi:flavin reductase (DIM6/NTAB) family NADH-FMN oxidoreductase RutF
MVARGPGNRGSGLRRHSGVLGYTPPLGATGAARSGQSHSTRQDEDRTIAMNDITPELFRKASGNWTTGVSVVTTSDVDGKPYGLTMNAVTSLSLNPPLFLICVDNRSDTLEPIRRSGVFCINVLEAAQQAVSNAFAKKGDDKFGGVSYERGVTGAPLLTGRLMAIECQVSAYHEAGDHKIFVGEVKNIDVNPDETAQPLLYYRGRYAALAP